MTKQKWFTFHWKNGTTTYEKGKDVGEAASIGIGGLGALDYWEETKELPDDHKEVRVILLDGSNEILHPNTMFVKQVKPQLFGGKETISIAILRRTYNCTVKKTPYEYVLTEM